jgi:pimeloyl-ACP methyl ester carboxylesterase
MEVTVVGTSAGPVEIALVPGAGSPVLFFPGGHCSARADCGWALYTRSGHGVVSFSRPGYGDTRVGALTAEEFAPVVREVCEQLHLDTVAAAVGASFGGMQAVHVAADPRLRVERLVLHSLCTVGVALPRHARRDGRWATGVLTGTARNRLAADSSPGAVGGWAAPDNGAAVHHSCRRVVGSAQSHRQDRGPSAVPEHAVGVGLRQRSLSRTTRGMQDRCAALTRVACPTLVTGSRFDAGVRFSHAQNLADTIPGAELVELDSPSHLFWLGPTTPSVIEWCMPRTRAARSWPARSPSGATQSGCSRGKRVQTRSAANSEDPLRHT